MAVTDITSFITLNNEAASRSLVPPFLLNIWQDLVQENIWAFNQVSGEDVPVSACTSYVQSERDIVVRGMNAAYRKMTRYLGFTPLQQWFTEDIPLGRGSPYQWQSLQTSMGYVTDYGQRATDLIEAAATITYSKSNDGYTNNDVATLTITTAVAADEIEVFFKVTDGAPGAADIRYQIYPLTITSTGTVATITGHRALFVEPNTIWQFPHSGPNYQDINHADTGTAGHFVTEVDVYRVYNDDTTPVQFLSDPLGQTLTDLDVNKLDTGKVLPMDNRLGLFNARMEAAASVYFHPRIARVHYRAGYRQYVGRMDDELAQALTRLGNTLMRQNPTDLCDRQSWSFQQDRSEGDTTTQTVNNPFGILVGQLAAWQVVNELALSRSGKLTRNIVSGRLW